MLSEPYAVNPWDVDWEGFVDFLRLHSADPDREFQRNRLMLLQDIDDVSRASCEAVQRIMPDKMTGNGLKESRSVLAEWRVHRSAGTTRADGPAALIAAPSSRGSDEPCDIRSIIDRLDCLALRSAQFMDTSFKLAAHPPRTDHLTRVIFVALPDPGDADSWVRLTGDDARREKRCSYYDSGAARLASTLMCASRPDLRYPGQDAENMWTAIQAVATAPGGGGSLRHASVLRYSCSGATHLLSSSDSLDRAVLETNWRHLLISAKKFVHTFTEMLQVELGSARGWDPLNGYDGEDDYGAEQVALPDSWRAMSVDR